jgi:desulfoferrodoxin (superoxide reductase-like protein)
MPLSKLALTIFLIKMGVDGHSMWPKATLKIKKNKKKYMVVTYCNFNGVKCR